MGGFAWVTLATNDSYALGALVLAHSLKRVNTAHQLAIMITPGVSEAMKTQLSAVFNLVKIVDVLDSRDEENLTLLSRPELGITFTKLHCWKLTQFDKCVFLDADTIVLQNSDELFERDELSAAPDIGWPDCFNSGVFVFKPSDKTYKDLIDFALVHGSFDGGDQGLLNLYFSDWATKDINKHLPFIYNVVSSAMYSYLPAFKQFKDKLKIIHFIGSSKPWLQPFDADTGFAHVTGEAQSQSTFIQLWWDLFSAYVHPSLTSNMMGLAAALAGIKLGAPKSEEESALKDHLRRQGWEEGNIDYMGKDSFDNIWKKISETISTGSSESQPPTTSEDSSQVDQSSSIIAPQISTQPQPPTTLDVSTSSSNVTTTQSEPTAVDLPKDSTLIETSTDLDISLQTPSEEIKKIVDLPVQSEIIKEETQLPLAPAEIDQKPLLIEQPPTLASDISGDAAEIKVSSTEKSSVVEIPKQEEAAVKEILPSEGQVAPIQSAPSTETTSSIKTSEIPSPTQQEVKTPPESITSKPSEKITSPTDLTPPPSPGKSPVDSKSVPPTPATPTITSPTPPQSPAATAFELPTIVSKLKVESETPQTPPVPQTADQPSLSESSGNEPPVPPKRKGGKGGAAQSDQQGKQQPKGSKGGKGKK